MRKLRVIQFVRVLQFAVSAFVLLLVLILPNVILGRNFNGRCQSALISHEPRYKGELLFYILRFERRGAVFRGISSTSRQSTKDGASVTFIPIEDFRRQWETYRKTNAVSKPLASEAVAEEGKPLIFEDQMGHFIVTINLKNKVEYGPNPLGPAMVELKHRESEDSTPVYPSGLLEIPHGYYAMVTSGDSRQTYVILVDPIRSGGKESCL